MHFCVAHINNVNEIFVFKLSVRIKVVLRLNKKDNYEYLTYLLDSFASCNVGTNNVNQFIFIALTCSYMCCVYFAVTYLKQRLTV